MPTSRHRRNGRARDRARRSPSWSDPELAVYGPFMRVTQSVNAHEAAGDAAGALDLMAQHPHLPDGRTFWAPWRVERLLQVAALPDVLPGWALSRWLLAQALVHMDESTRRITTKAMRLACDVGGVPDLARSRGPERREAFCRVMEGDWVYRQAYLFEYGGLRHYLAGGFAPVLVRQADAVEEWVGAPMGAYRLEGRAPRTLVWRDLVADVDVESLDLGAAVRKRPGDHVIGRLVPSRQGRLFESVPLRVGAEVAEAVASAPAAWADALRGRDVPSLSAVGDCAPFLTDVPTVGWESVAIDNGGTPEDIEEAAAALVMAALAGDLDASLDPYAAAALLAPGVWPVVVDRLDRRDAAALASFGQRLAGPAGELCLRTARLLRESA